MDAQAQITETAKQRALRVPLDHYGQPDRIVRGKFWLSLVAACIGLIYSVWLLLGVERAKSQASGGPLAAVHAAWDHQCDQCHRDFHPLRADAVDLTAIVRGTRVSREAADQACVRCHAGPPHHANMKAEEIAPCAACHREHQGAAADIVRPSDQACTTCHRQIELHRTGPSTLRTPLENVTAFAPQQHPAFRSLGSDPGNIKFNHWLHLQPGLAVAEAKHKLRIEDVDETHRSRYQPLVQDGLIQLDCAACHQPAISGNMQPIAYEQHCRACHSLAVKLSGDERSLAEVPHGLSPERLTVLLDGLLMEVEQKMVEVPLSSADESGEQPLIPGKTLGRNLAQKIGADLRARRDKAAAIVTAKCSECHLIEPAAKSPADVLPANIPAAWCAHARFDHSAHRHVECRACHAGAYSFEERSKPRMIAPVRGALPPGLAAAHDDSQVMIAGLESCIACHAPGRGGQGGARFDCAECHHYHGGEQASPRSGHPRSGSIQSPMSGIEDVHLGRWPLDLGLVATPVSLSLSSPAFLGAANCASAGCHGSARQSVPVWQRAFSTWIASDPHAHAYDVLWTFRARTMTGSMERQLLSDDEHFRVLQQRCVGCHATPA